MADPQVLSELEDFVREDLRDVVHQQAGFVQNTVALNMPMEEDYEPPPASDRTARPIAVKRNAGKQTRVNVVYGGSNNFGVYSDNSARPTGGGVDVAGANKQPVLFGDRLSFSLAEIELANGSDDSTIDKFLVTAKAHGSLVGANMARSIINPVLAEPTGDVSVGATTMTVTAAAGYVVGGRCEVRADSDDSLIGYFTVADISIAFDLTAVITFGSALTFAIDVSAQTIYLLGQGGSDSLGSLDDAVNSSLALYGLIEATQFPAGLSYALGGPFSNSVAKTMSSIVTSQGDRITHYHTSEHGRDRILNAQQDNVRFIMGDKKHEWDPFQDSSVPVFNGAPIVACPQADDDELVMGDFSKIELREHVPYGPRMIQGAGKAGMGKSALKESNTVFGYDLDMHGFYATVITKRRAFGKITGITS